MPCKEANHGSPYSSVLYERSRGDVGEDSHNQVEESQEIKKLMKLNPTPGALAA